MVNILQLGAEKPKSQQKLQEWCEQEEKKVESIDSKEVPILLNVKLGLIYIKSGYLKEGLYSLECALTQAQHENLADLYADIKIQILENEPTNEQP